MTTRSRPSQLDIAVPLIFGAFALGAGAVVGLATSIINPFFVVVMLAGLAGVYATLLRVEWGMALLLFLMYSRVTDQAVRVFGAPPLTPAFIPLLFGVVIVRAIIYGKYPKGWQLPGFLLVLYGVLVLSGALYAHFPNRSIAYLNNYSRDAMFAFTIIILLQNGITMRRVVWALLTAGILLGTLSIFQYLTGTYDNIYWGFARAELAGIVGGSSDYRIGGSIGDPNYHAQIMLVLVPLAFDRVMTEKTALMRGLAGWALLVTVLNVILTFSRGGFLGLLVVGGIIMVMHPPRPSMLFVAAVVLFFIVQLAPAQYTERMRTLLDFVPGMSQSSPLEEGSLRDRTSKFAIGWNMFMDYPVLGVGVNNYNFRHDDYARNVGNTTNTQVKSAHSLYLEILAETGIVGMTIFLGIIYAVYRSISSARRLFLAAGQADYASLAVAIGIGFIGYLVTAIFLHDAHARYFWLLFGIAISLQIAAQHEFDKKQKQDSLTLANQ